MENLRKIREKRKMTQEQLAQKLDVGRTTVTLWELGVNSPRADMLVKLSKVLRCKVDDLLCTKA